MKERGYLVKSVMKSCSHSEESADKRMIQGVITPSDASERIRSFLNLSVGLSSLAINGSTSGSRIMFVKGLQCTQAWYTLVKLVAKVTGYRQYTMLSPRNDNAPSYILCIDPFGRCQIYTPKDCTIQLITMMVDLSIPIQAKYTLRLTKGRQRGQEASIKVMLCDTFPAEACYPQDRAVSLTSLLQQRRQLRSLKLMPRQSQSLRAEPTRLTHKNADAGSKRPTHSGGTDTKVIDVGIGTDDMGEVLPEPCHHRRVHEQMWTCFECTTFRAYAFFEIATLHLGQS